MDEHQDERAKGREYSRRYREKDLDTYRARNAAYQREWRARPENIERARASSRRSRERAIAADPEGFKRRQQERYQRHIAKPGSIEKHRASGRRRYEAGLTRRRGLTLAERHDYWLLRDRRCDLCGHPCDDPVTNARSRSRQDTVVDHDKTHCGSSIGCLDCVRGQGHRSCNLLEGFVRKALDMGVLSGAWGPLMEYLADPPMQRWVRQRRALRAVADALTSPDLDDNDTVRLLDLIA